MKGLIDSSTSIDTVKVSKMDGVDWSYYQSFWDWQPTWQYAIASILNQMDSLEHISISDGNNVLAYAIFNRSSGKVFQFSTHPEHRRKGLARKLFTYIGQKVEKELLVINLDHDAQSTKLFLKELGLKSFITQLEMTCLI